MYCRGHRGHHRGGGGVPNYLISHPLDRRHASNIEHVAPSYPKSNVEHTALALQVALLLGDMSASVALGGCPAVAPSACAAGGSITSRRPSRRGGVGGGGNTRRCLAVIRSQVVPAAPPRALGGGGGGALASHTRPATAVAALRWNTAGRSAAPRFRAAPLARSRGIAASLVGENAVWQSCELLASVAL